MFYLKIVDKNNHIGISFERAFIFKCEPIKLITLTSSNSHESLQICLLVLSRNFKPLMWTILDSSSLYDVAANSLVVSIIFSKGT